MPKNLIVTWNYILYIIYTCTVAIARKPLSTMRMLITMSSSYSPDIRLLKGRKRKMLEHQLKNGPWIVYIAHH